MERRHRLNAIFKEVLGSDNVYFEPPPSVNMKYDAIVYHRANISTNKADNKIYNMRNSYSVVIISRNPDNHLADSLITRFPYIRFIRRESIEGLVHDYLALYY